MKRHLLRTGTTIFMFSLFLIGLLILNNRTPLFADNPLSTNVLAAGSNQSRLSPPPIKPEIAPPPQLDSLPDAASFIFEEMIGLDEIPVEMTVIERLNQLEPLLADLLAADTDAEQKEETWNYIQAIRSELGTYEQLLDQGDSQVAGRDSGILEEQPGLLAPAVDASSGGLESDSLTTVVTEMNAQLDQLIANQSAGRATYRMTAALLNDVQELSGASAGAPVFAPDTTAPPPQRRPRRRRSICLRAARTH
jgi:hypothetical protein